MADRLSSKVLDMRNEFASTYEISTDCYDGNTMKKLNKELEFKDDKSCRFTCALSLCWPDGYNITVQGEIFGEFSWPPTGKNGFGYDPIFFYPRLKKTFGELDPAIKHEISHRNLAFKKLKTKIEKIVHE